MENAVEALKMAGSVLLFIIALSVAILSFTISRESLDKIIKYADRESLRIENDSRFYYIANDNDIDDVSRREDRTKRYVGLETIIPTIYRSNTERFKIIFEFNSGSYDLYSKDTYDATIGTITTKKVNKIDTAMDELGLANDEKNIEFLNGIIYGLPNTAELNNYQSEFKVKLPSKCLYNYISEWLSNGHKILENLGTYYMEDVTEDGSVSDLTNNNKNEKRVITYTFEN